MKFPTVKGKRWPVVILLLFLLPIVFTVIFALSFPTLAAPTKSIPPLNPQETQIHTYNAVTKLKAGVFSMFQSGTGKGTFELSSAEVNALLSQGLARGDYRLIGSTTRFVGDKLYLDLAVEWRGHVLGPEIVLKPQATGGDIAFLVEKASIGRLPLPRTYLSAYVKSVFPRDKGLSVVESPLTVVYDPDVLLSQISLPLIKDPKLFVENLALGNDKLALTAWLSFRIGF